MLKQLASSAATGADASKQAVFGGFTFTSKPVIEKQEPKKEEKKEEPKVQEKKEEPKVNPFASFSFGSKPASETKTPAASGKTASTGGVSEYN